MTDQLHKIATRIAADDAEINWELAGGFVNNLDFLKKDIKSGIDHKDPEEYVGGLAKLIADLKDQLEVMGVRGSGKLLGDLYEAIRGKFPKK